MSSLTILAVLLSTPVAAAAVAGSAAAIPIIIHLLNRRRYVVVPWAAMKFLLAARKRHSRRLKIEQWLLLLTRALVAFLLVCALAAAMPWAESFWQWIFPSEKVAAPPQGRVHRVLVLDSSFTMETRRDDGALRWDRACALARELIDKSRSGDGFSLVQMASPSQTIVQGPSEDKGRFLAELEKLNVTQGAADVPSALRLVADLVNRPLGDYAQREVIFLTDLRRSVWPIPNNPLSGATTNEAWRRILDSARVITLDCAGRDVENLSISNLALSESIPLIDTDLNVMVTIQNHSSQLRSQIPVDLLVGKVGDRLTLREVGQILVDLQPFSSTTVTFKIEKQNRFREAGHYIFQAKIPNDSLPTDDTRSLVVPVRDRIAVTVVNGKASPEPLDRASGFLVPALNPDGSISAEFPADVRVLTPNEFRDAGTGDLFNPASPTEVLFLCDVPSFGSAETARLSAFLKKGGGIVLSFGPNTANNLENYNRVLWDEGKGIMPARILGIRRAQENGFYTLSGDDEVFKTPPLAAFRGEAERASLGIPRFYRYLKLDTPTASNTRRLLSLNPSEKQDTAPDAALLETIKFRGKVLVYTSTFNTEWNEWPRTLSFPPFVQEILRHMAVTQNRLTVLAGDSLEEYIPSGFIGLNATFRRVGGGQSLTEIESATVQNSDEVGWVRFDKAHRTGVYLCQIGGKLNVGFAVNVPTTNPTGGAESDLTRVSINTWQENIGEGDFVVATDLAEIPARPKKLNTTEPPLPTSWEPLEKRGPVVAFFLVILFLLLLGVESILAWYFGSARVGLSADPNSIRPNKALAFVYGPPLLLGGFILLVVLHAFTFGKFLNFLPVNWQKKVGEWIDVPSSGPGESPLWRIERFPPPLDHYEMNLWVLFGLAFLGIVGFFYIYSLEKLGGGGASRSIKSPIWRLASLRFLLYALGIFVLLPQAQLSFDRERWPNVVLLIDDSRSMSVVDEFRIPEVKAEAERLKEIWTRISVAEIQKVQAKIAQLTQEIETNADSPKATTLRNELERAKLLLTDLKTPHRLNLVKALLADREGAFIRELVGGRKVRLHVYRMSTGASRIYSLESAEATSAFLEELMSLIPNGESSRLGDSVQQIFDEFRGDSLDAIIAFTDGMTTNGKDLTTVAKPILKGGGPLLLVGIGDATEPLDVSLSDLRAEEVINLNDRLVMDLKLTWKGPNPPASVPVILKQQLNDKTIELAREFVQPDRLGNPVKVRFLHQPKEVGPKVYIIETPVQPDEKETANNKIEHRVNVVEAKTIRLLMIEATPRWEWRYLKTLFEREMAVGNARSIEMDTFLLSAHPDATREKKQDRSLIGAIPSYEQMKQYDVILLGDISPREIPRGEQVVTDLTKFVKEHGGGLIVLSGPNSTPAAYKDTPLEDVLPIQITNPPVAPAKSEPYRPKLTPSGQSHPLFRFASEDSASLEIWNQLPPLLAVSTGYRRKLSAEVLAVHPTLMADGGGDSSTPENHPLVLQQFVGSGRVLFLGFDDTWRWRPQQGERLFNQFWYQMVRTLAKGRVGRIEVRTDQKTYRRDEPMRITVRFPDDSPPPVAGTTVRLQLERRSLPQGGFSQELESQSLALSLKSGTRATYETTWTRTSEGEYLLTLTSPEVSGTRPKTEARVLPPPGEMDRVELNEKQLKDAASLSQGKYYPLSEAEKILSELPESSRIVLGQLCDPVDVWRHWSLLVLMLSLLTAEWIARKRWRLL
jgi:uncharacterized membrane protein